MLLLSSFELMASGRSQLLVGHCRSLGSLLAFGCSPCLAACLVRLSPRQHPAKQLVVSEQGKRTDRESKGDGSQSSVALRQELEMQPRLALCSLG